MNVVSGSPSPIFVEPRYEWVEGDAESNAHGFACEIRTNLRNRERRALSEMAQQKPAWDPELHAVLAPLVRDWNIYERADGEDPVKAAPPAVGGPEQFELVPWEWTQWLYVQLITAYRGGKGSKSSSGASGGPQVPTSGSPVKTGSGEAAD